MLAKERDQGILKQRLMDWIRVYVGAESIINVTFKVAGKERYLANGANGSWKQGSPPGVASIRVHARPRERNTTRSRDTSQLRDPGV